MRRVYYRKKDPESRRVRDRDSWRYRVVFDAGSKFLLRYPDARSQRHLADITYHRGPEARKRHDPQHYAHLLLRPYGKRLRLQMQKRSIRTRCRQQQSARGGVPAV